MRSHGVPPSAPRWPLSASATRTLQREFVTGGKPGTTKQPERQRPLITKDISQDEGSVASARKVNTLSSKQIFKIRNDSRGSTESTPTAVDEPIIPLKPRSTIDWSIILGTEPGIPRPDLNVEDVISDDFQEAVNAGCPVECAMGVDVCDISRIERMRVNLQDSQAYVRFSSRVLTSIELQLQKRATEDNRHDRNKNIAEFLAGRWAAKEAIIKAVRAHHDLETGRKTFMHDIVILPAAVLKVVDIFNVDKADYTAKAVEGRREVELIREAQEKKGPLRAFVRTGPEEKSEKWLEVAVSISHDGGNAIAVAFVATPELRKIHTTPISTKELDWKTEKGEVGPPNSYCPGASNELDSTEQLWLAAKAHARAEAKLKAKREQRRLATQRKKLRRKLTAPSASTAERGKGPM